MTNSVLPAGSSVGASREFRRGWTAIVLLLTLLPYFIERKLTPPGAIFTWMLPPYPADSYAYRAWAKQAFDGRWLFSLKFTALPHRPFLFLPFFLVAGKLSRLFRADIGVIFLLLKSVGVLVFFRSFFDFARSLRFSRLQTTAAAVIAGVGSGLGGFAPLVFPEGLSRAWTPVDVWIVDSNTFWSLLWNPVFPFSLALMLQILRLSERSVMDGSPKDGWRAGAGLVGLALLHPYPLAVLYPLLTILCVVRRRGNWLIPWSRIVGASSIPAATIVALSAYHPIIREHNNLGTEAGVSWFALGAGFGLPLLAAGWAAATDGGFRRRHWMLLAWFAISVGLTASPLWFRLKYLFGAHLPLSLLAGAACESLLAAVSWNRAAKAAAVAVSLFVMTYTQLFNLREALMEFSANDDGLYFIPTTIYSGLEFLDSRSDHDRIVFASPPSSAKICAFSGHTVLWGHWAQSVDSRARREWIQEIFSPDSALSVKERRDRLWGSGVDSLFLDGNWRMGIRTGLGPSILSGTKLVFENPSVAIYERVRPTDGARRSPENQASSAATSFSSPTSRR